MYFTYVSYRRAGLLGGVFPRTEQIGIRQSALVPNLTRAEAGTLGLPGAPCAERGPEQTRAMDGGWLPCSMRVVLLFLTLFSCSKEHKKEVLPYPVKNMLPKYISDPFPTYLP